MARAAERAAEAGHGWLHVDHEPHLQSSYQDARCLRPTDAGLLHLAPQA